MKQEIEFLREIERQIKAAIDQVNENIKGTGARVWYPDSIVVEGPDCAWRHCLSGRVSVVSD